MKLSAKRSSRKPTTNGDTTGIVANDGQHAKIKSASDNRYASQDPRAQTLTPTSDAEPDTDGNQESDLQHTDKHAEKAVRRDDGARFLIQHPRRCALPRKPVQPARFGQIGVPADSQADSQLR